MASVRKRTWTHKGVDREAWVVAYTDQGGKRRLKTFEKKKEADKYRQTVEAEIDAGIHTPYRDTMTFREAAAEFERECERRHRADDGMTRTTVVSYHTVLKRLLPHFGSRKLTDLTSLQVEEFFNQEATWRRKSTVASTFRVLNMVLALAVKRRWIRRNVLRDDPIRLPTMVNERPRVPTKEEIRALMEATLNRHPRERSASLQNRRLVIILGVFAGLRRGEMVGLQWENIDFAAGLIYLRHSQSTYDGLKCPKTKAGVRDIPMSRPVRWALEEVLAYWRLQAETAAATRRGGTSASAQSRALTRRVRRGDIVDAASDVMPTGYVLHRPSGATIGVEVLYRHYWRSTMADAGLLTERGLPRFTLHSLRHAAASLFIEAGLPPMHLKTVIGHSSVKTTYDIYGHLFPEDGVTRAAVDRIAAQFDATPARQELLTR